MPSVLMDAVRAAPYEAVYFEMPPLCAETINMPAEFVLVSPDYRHYASPS